ncbi:MAG: ATP-binding protein [Gemmatimonadota bacterium]|nr:ATP-binding protein [Gemmatimonadota bacterium]
MAIPKELLGSASSSRTVCRYEVKINVSREPTFVSETLCLTPIRRSATTQRQLFPHPQSPPGQIALAPGEHAPKGWRRVVSRGREPERVNYRAERSGWNAPFRIAPWESALANLPADDERFPVALWFRERMRGARRIALSGEAMRRPCPPIRLNEYLPDGSNLPHVVQRLEETYPTKHEGWIRHVREALPDISNITTRERDEDRHRYLVIEHDNGLEVPSWLISDGTLRLLALTVLAYLPDLSGIYLIEEPENGLHPRAIETVFQSLSSVYQAQVLLTTHSPLVARLTQPDELLCVARDEQMGTDIVAGTEHPLLRDWQGQADLGTLFASGVLG